jgi:hypothetical protein
MAEGSADVQTARPQFKQDFARTGKASRQVGHTISGISGLFGDVNRSTSPWSEMRMTRLAHAF